MDTSDFIPDENLPEPTTRQKERASSLNKFNWFYLYLPSLLIAAICVAIIVYLLVITLPDDFEARRNIISAIADGLVILAIMPLLLICGALPMSIAVAIVQARRRGMAPIHRIQRLFWRVDTGLVNISQRARNITTRSVQPLINVHAIVQFILTLFDRFKNMLKRS